MPATAPKRARTTAGAVSGVPVIIQSKFAQVGNYELVVPRPTGGLVHYWRTNDDVTPAWNGPNLFGESAGVFDAATMIQANFDKPGNLELAAVNGNDLYFFWRDSGPAFDWNGPFFLGTDVCGAPALIQSRFGRRGNFELVVPSSTGGIKFFLRDNDKPDLPWSLPTTFGESLGQVTAVSLAQAGVRNLGDLAVVALAGEDLFLLTRDSGPNFAWGEPELIGSGFCGNPSLIRSRFGHQGNFELVAPLVTGGLGHLVRDNDQPSPAWSPVTPFGTDCGPVAAASLMHSTLGDRRPGNLEVVARVGNGMVLFTRDSGPAFLWSDPVPISVS